VKLYKKDARKNKITIVIMDCSHIMDLHNQIVNQSEENRAEEIDRELYNKAFTAFKEANDAAPICCDNNTAQFRVALKKNRDNYGRPYFVCSKDKDGCDYFEWGDKAITPRPRCYHNETSAKRRVRKQGPNKGRFFFSCPRHFRDVTQCDFFQWEDLPFPKDETPIPETPPKEDKKDDLDDILTRFTFPKIPSSQYRIPKRKKTPPPEKKNDDDDDVIPDSQTRITKWTTPRRKKQKILSSDSEEEEEEKPQKYLFYTRDRSGASNGSFYCK
jgi:hypothetical protein